MQIQDIVLKIEKDLEELEKKSGNELFEVLQPPDAAIQNKLLSLLFWIKNDGKEL